MEFRLLKANEIQVRPTDTKFQGSATLLLYQDARCAMDILDETVGNENWQKEYYEVKGNVYCRIGINTESGWVWKSDCGTESNMDAEKGQASDAFKRAAVCWGIGRELYSGPRVKVKNLPDSYYYNDKLTMTFSVSEIGYTDRKITKLVLVDRFGKEVYRFSEEDECVPVQNESLKLRKTNDEILKEFCTATKENPEVDKADLLRFYNFYMKKMGTWEGPFKPETLWNRWCETRKN